MRLILLLIFGLFQLQVAAQQDCAELLSRANGMYEAGQIAEVINLVSSCAQSGSEKDRWQAYRLLSLAHLANSQRMEARTAAIGMLEINPSYRSTRLNDPVEFSNLLQSINVIPRFALGLAVSAGTNRSFLQIPASYVLGDYSKKYSARSGYQLGSSLSYYLSPVWMLSYSALLTTKGYTMDFEPAGWTSRETEQLTYLESPFSVRYILNPNSRLRPFAQAGLFGGYLLGDYVQLRAESAIYENRILELEKADVLNRRNRFNWGFMAGLGAFYKLNEGQICVQLNYFQSMRQINKPEERYSNIDQMYNYFLVDDDMYIHNLSVSVGYDMILNYRVFKPKGNGK